MCCAEGSIAKARFFVNDLSLFAWRHFCKVDCDFVGFILRQLAVVASKQFKFAAIVLLQCLGEFKRQLQHWVNEQFQALCGLWGGAADMVPLMRWGL